MIWDAVFIDTFGGTKLSRNETQKCKNMDVTNNTNYKTMHVTDNNDLKRWRNIS